MSDKFTAQEVFLAGRVVEGPIQTKGGKVHYRFDIGLTKPMHLVASGKTAQDLIRFVGVGDEMSVEGQLEWVDFPNTGPTLVINVRYPSYGRKAKPIGAMPSLR